VHGVRSDVSREGLECPYTHVQRHPLALDGPVGQCPDQPVRQVQSRGGRRHAARQPREDRLVALRIVVLGLPAHVRRERDAPKPIQHGTEILFAFPCEPQGIAFALHHQANPASGYFQGP